MANDALIRNSKQKKNQELFYDDTQVRTLLDFFAYFICKTRLKSHPSQSVPRCEHVTVEFFC